MRLGLEAGKDTISLARKHGAAGVPISASALAKDGAEATSRPIRDAGLAVCQVGAFSYNPLHPDGGTRSRERTALLESIPLLEAVECPYVVISGGNYHPNAFGGVDLRNFTPGALDSVARELEEPLRVAEEHEAIISIEPYLKSAVCSADAFLSLYRRCKSRSLKVNLDVTSLYDFRALVDPTLSWQDTCDKLAPYIGLVHVKEVGLAEGFHIHAGLVPLSQGKTDWRSLFQRVAGWIPKDGWVILEHVQSEEELEESLPRLRGDLEAAGLV